MHQSSYLRMEYLIRYYEKYLEEKGTKKVLDIGSYSVNGSYKQLFDKSKWDYIGLDVCEGPNVDFIPEDLYSWKELADDTFDFVISGQTFEHIEFPWLTIKEVARVLKPSGFCIITAPNAGNEHKYPTDCYRYFGDGLAALAKWGGMHVHHAGVAGVPHLEETEEWKCVYNDATLVAQKAPALKKIEDPFKYECRYQWHAGKYALCEQYKDNTEALQIVKEHFNNDKKYIIFGAGAYGRNALNMLGEENVYAFCDNNEEKVGMLFCEKPVISKEELFNNCENYNCVIATSRKAYKEIRVILDEQGIDYQWMLLSWKA